MNTNRQLHIYIPPIANISVNNFRGNNNIINLYTSYEKNVQLSSNKYLLLLLLLL